MNDTPNDFSKKEFRSECDDNARYQQSSTQNKKLMEVTFS